MSFSQFTMAALVQMQDGRHLAICGDLTTEEGRIFNSAEIFFVVHQGTSVVRGRGERDPSKNEWGACSDVVPPSLSVGEAVAMGVVVVERENPVGFTTLTWTQDITIIDKLPEGRENPCLEERGASTAQPHG
jgi:hypothetical protein